jgi:cell division protein FtsW (lipid II flippase)
LLFGAALDGHPGAPGLAAVAHLPAGQAPSQPGCARLDIGEALSATSMLMADARAAPVNIDKNDAMRTLLQTAGWQWTAWSVLGLALLNLARRVRNGALGIALALAAWAAAAYVARVPWPFAPEGGLVLARESASPLSAPATFVVALLVAAATLATISPWLRRPLASGRQRIASAFGYPGLVVAAGVGWLLLLDLSANGHLGNRYLALYHQGHLWLGMLTLTVIAFARQPIGRALGWTLSVLEGAASALGRRLGTAASTSLLVALAIALIAAVGALLVNVRQLTSEIGRLWLVVGAAWFFFLRGTPLTERLARSGSTIGSLLRYVWPLLFVVTVLIGAMLATRDMGPLLIAGYGAGAFVAASIAMWNYQRNHSSLEAYALAVTVFVAWIVAATFALLRLGAIDDVTAGRLENLAAPLASANDQLALVTWFQRAAPDAGFGPGSVPWCGFGAQVGCSGVPAQIHSDYTFTAIVGMFGWTAAWAFTLGCAVWLHGLVRPHGAATRGEPRFVRAGAHLVNDEQAFASWLCVAWVVLALCQLAVTVAGNLAVIPLTGVTFPFVSFGMTSLVSNMAMLGLALTVNERSRDADG